MNAWLKGVRCALPSLVCRRGWKPPTDRRDPVELLSDSNEGCIMDADSGPLRAHARPGDAAMIAGYTGSGQTFDDAITEFATEHSSLNRRDYREFIRASDGPDSGDDRGLVRSAASHSSHRCSPDARLPGHREPMQR